MPDGSPSSGERSRWKVQKVGAQYSPGHVAEDIQRAFCIALALYNTVSAQSLSEETRKKSRGELRDCRRRNLGVSETSEEIDHLIAWAQENEVIREFLATCMGREAPWTSCLEDLWTKELDEFRRARNKEDDEEFIQERTVEQGNAEESEEGPPSSSLPLSTRPTNLRRQEVITPLRPGRRMRPRTSRASSPAMVLTRPVTSKKPPAKHYVTFGEQFIRVRGTPGVWRIYGSVSTKR